MPLYEYQCEPCGHRFEKIRKFSDPPLDTCPVCGPQKLVSSPAIQFGHRLVHHRTQKSSGRVLLDRAERIEFDR